MACEFLLVLRKDRPTYLWVFWILTSVALFFLLLAMLVDELTGANIKLEFGDEDLYTCGWNSLDNKSGGSPNGYEYRKKCDDESECVETASAGEAWIAFNILAIISYCILAWGIFKDFYATRFDSTKIDCGDSGCAIPWGFTIIGCSLVILWSLLAMISWSGGEQCSNEKLWEFVLAADNTDLIKSFDSFGGASIGLAAIHFIIFCLACGVVAFVRITNGELPKGKEQENPVKFQKKAVIAPGQNTTPVIKTSPKTPPKSAPKPKGPPPAPLFQAQQVDEASYHRNSKIESRTPSPAPPVVPNTRPTGPPPKPGPRPNMPPPRPPT